MNPGEKAEKRHMEEHRKFFRDVLLRVNEIMEGKYKLHAVSVRPLGAGGARLSIPVKIEGLNEDERRVRYFGKIIGGSDLMTARTMQFMKNIFLETNSREPLFDFASSAEDMARYQFDQMSAIHDLGIPTAQPYGYHPLKGQMWLLVAEFLEAIPLTDVKDLSPEQIETVFKYLDKMHHKGIYHGDLKPENIMFGDRIYILDVGQFLEEAPAEEKMAYDLASLICAFVEFEPPEVVVKIAGKYYRQKQLTKATENLELIQNRPDFHFDDATRDKLSQLMIS
jgi:tRNA A-37 threonylcarbamoyl transferase component Bud32